ncbi:EF-P lysine aminoacylase GenX [Desulfonema ishimotonii]|uniref:EF-P lysine aminoacylase GenX n=2 Tax=Desulfonema ishimotonii TaxID=45657 RepID=A0A401G3G5_9BACT|nr:EF-P lysine aminoacylase GenX [Desulfonema ishimotonii]
MIQAVRRFFTDRDFLEVETPNRIPAPAPEAHIDAVPSDGWFLHTSPELCMKRLLASGYPRIFQICKCFRRGERGQRHLTEFTLLEWYEAGADYIAMMAQCEALIRFAARETGVGDTLTCGGDRVDLRLPWDRLTVREAFKRFSPVPMDEALATDRFDEMIGCEIEPHLGRKRPVFLYDYPASCGALARLKPADPSVAERFELYICGLELCNAFTELTDPDEQRRRFEAEQALREEMGKTAYPTAERFLSALEFMPDAAGNALGLDRLAMLFADAPAIDDVVAFTPEEL